MKFITLMNSYSIYFLEKRGYINFFINYINMLLNLNEKFVLKDYFNMEKSEVRSYVIFESLNYIVFMDFNIFNSSKLYEDDKAIIEYIKKTETKKVIFIMFNMKDGKDSYINDEYNLYRKSNIFYAKSKRKQLRYEKKMINELYQMDLKVLGLYMHEIYLKCNL
jgi:hypothetical protein